MINRAIPVDEDGAGVGDPRIVDFEDGIVVIDDELAIHVKVCVAPAPIDRGDRRAALTRITLGMAVRVVEARGDGEVVAVKDRMDARQPLRRCLSKAPKDSIMHIV